MKDTADVTKRAENFFSAIVATDKIFYILHPNTGIFISESNNYSDLESGNPAEILPVWSKAYLPYAKQYASGLKIISIELSEFMQQMLPQMIESGVILGINWDHLGYGVEIEPEAVLVRLKNSKQ